MYSLPYIFIFILLFVLSIPIVNTNKRNINIIWQYYAVFFILAVFIGFRGFIFTDWRLYYAYYQEVPLLTDGINNIVSFLTKSKYSVYEKGFSLFTIIIKTLSTDYFIYQFLSFSIDLIILFYFFKYYIPDYILLGFVFFFMFNGVIGLGIEINFLRNAKALMLFLISVKYAQEKNIIVYSILNILGIFFHISSIIYLLIYPFLNRRFNYITYIMVFLLGNIIYLLQ
ncbi:MAG: EpsG family protein [Candidatus Treponema excrementipullorum]|nr:EpsG family protein [Candidatus Treponema excrementipullorum]